MKFTTIYEKSDEGGFIGYVAELPGTNTQGETLEETSENRREAVSLLIECYRDDAEKRVSATSNSTKEELVLKAA